MQRPPPAPAEQAQSNDHTVQAIVVAFLAFIAFVHLQLPGAAAVAPLVRSLQQSGLPGAQQQITKDVHKAQARVKTPTQPIPVGWVGYTIGGKNPMVSFNQTDARWTHTLIAPGQDNIGWGGCGQTSLAMVDATLLHQPGITPVAISRRYGSRYYNSIDGTQWGIFPANAADYHLHYQNLGTDLGQVASILARRGLVVASFQSYAGNPSYFTTAGHIMVIRGMNTQSGNFYFADPAGDGANHGGTEETGFQAAFLKGGGYNQGHLVGLWGYWK